MNYGDEYLETRVMTAAPQELHMMVVDGAIRFATQAQESFGDDDFESAHLSLCRSREFVAELIAGLDTERKDDVVEKLRGVFGIVYRSLNDAELERDVEKVRAALRILHVHRDTWRQLTEQLKSENIGNTPPPTKRSWST